jgi:hypothetical protein
VPVLKSLSSRTGLTALVAAAVAFVLINAANVHAEPIVGPGGPSGAYAFAGESCTGKKSDPVGVLFRGKHGGPTNVAKFITEETWNWESEHYELFGGPEMWGWEFAENDHRQGLEVHEPNGEYGCSQTDAARAEATEDGPNSRYHVRLWYVPASAGTGEAKTVGTPHHELYRNPVEYHNCEGVTGLGNHAINHGGINQQGESGFDMGRHRLREAFESRHATEVEMWGNTVEFEQCDGGMAGSDGHGITIWINNSLHAHTASASSIKETSSTLNGHLTTEEASTEYWFGYGPNSSYGVTGYPNKTSVKSLSGSAELDPSTAISGLTPNTQYYARLFARNQDGEVQEGNEVNFIYSPAPITGEDDDFPGPHVVGNSNGAVDTFFRTPSGTLGHAWTQGGAWSEQDISATSLSSTSVPHPVIQPNGMVDVFWRTPSGELGHAWDDSTGWHSGNLPGSVASDPHATVQPNGTIDVFYRTPSGELGHDWYPQGGPWASGNLPGSVASDPYAVAQSNGTIDVFYRTPSGELGHDWYPQGSPWAAGNLPGSVASVAHPVVQSNGTIDVFYRTPSGELGHDWYSPGGTWASGNLPGSVASEPHAVDQPNGTLDVFWRTPSGELGHDWYQPGGQWNSNILSGSVASDPYAVTRINGTVDVFWRTTAGELGHAWTGPGTEGWHAGNLAGPVGSVPHAVAQPNGTLDVLYRTPAGELGHDWYQQGGEWRYNILFGSLALEPPIATTEAATAVKGTTATLNGKVNPEGTPATYQFEYGKTTSYGTKVPASPTAIGAGVSNVALSQAISSLEAGTTYHYRVVATNREGTTNGEDKTFKTESATLPGQLNGMVVTDPLNGSTSAVSNFATSWSALGWASGSPAKGEDVASGWHPTAAYPTPAGASYSPTVTDTGPGMAAVATLATNPGIAERYFSVWLDMPTPSSTRAGYELRFTDTATNIYEVKLSKWVSGSQTVLASKSGYSLSNGNSFAIVDLGGIVSAWTNTGSGFSQLLSANDSTFSSGNSAVEGAGNNTRLTSFKVGQLLTPVASMDAALKALALNEAFAINENPLSGGGIWAALNWDNSGSGHNTGRVEGGWGPYDAYSAINGAYWTKASFADTGAGDAVSALLYAKPNGTSRYFSLWLDMPTPASAHTGYELRFTETSSGVYEVALCKWQAGTKTSLATKTSYTFATGSQFALADKMGTVSVWTKTGSEYTQLLSASDSTFTSGYTGVEGSGNITRLKEFRSGPLAPF